MGRTSACLVVLQARQISLDGVSLGVDVLGGGVDDVELTCKDLLQEPSAPHLLRPSADWEGPTK